MTYETRTYDNEHGDPVVVLVVTGSHDVSRLVNTLTRRGNCEQGDLAARIVRQVRRHNGGRAALGLLARHGGPDLLTPTVQWDEGQVIERDLPGLWERADFEGGQDYEVRGPDWKPS